jgi:biofilm protein TabA
MFSTKIGVESKYDMNAPKFKTAYEFLKRPDLAALPEGWIELDNGVRASVQHYTTSSRGSLSFESHERFFDIQFMIEGQELIGVVSREGLIEKTPYAKADDCTLYKDPDFYGEVFLRPGDFVILAPEDVHKPRCAAGKPMAVKKIVCKVPV